MRIRLFGTFAVVALALGGAAALAAGGAPAGPPSYTSDQAWHGRLEYIQNCAECHGGGLQGQMGPALAGGGDRVQYETVQYVYSYFSVFMPHGNPGALPQSDYVDIMAFLLQQHHVPAGSRPLTPAAIAADMKPVGP